MEVQVHASVLHNSTFVYVLNVSLFSHTFNVHNIVDVDCEVPIFNSWDGVADILWSCGGGEKSGG